MITLKKTNRYDINLKKPFATMYTAIAESEGSVIKMLTEELSKDGVYSVDQFEIEYCGKATDQMGNYFKKEIKAEM